MLTISFNPQNNPMRNYCSPNFTDGKTEATPQGSGRHGIMNPDSLAPKPTV